MAQIINHITVTRDGMHNAFTDLIFWRGRYWITYRKARRHRVDPDGAVTVASSPEPQEFREIARLKVPGDCRDPRFAALGEDRLAVLFPVVAESGQPGSEEALQQFIAFSSDSRTWEPARPILPPRHHIFRVRRHEGAFYGLDIIRERGTSRLEVAVSENLMDWSKVAAVGGTSEALNEADIHFRRDGEAWIIARTTRKPDDAVFCRAQPPYAQWEITDLHTLIHAPAFLEHEGVVYVAGRCNPRRDGYAAWPFNNSLGLWKVTAGHIEQILHIPAIGDCSYPGFIKDPQGRIFVSYYSQHAYYMGVLPPFAGKLSAQDESDPKNAPYAADIYLAELKLP